METDYSPDKYILLRKKCYLTSPLNTQRVVKDKRGDFEKLDSRSNT